MENNYQFEEEILKKNANYNIGGIDEVGRGPLVGPVVAACVVLPKYYKLPGLTDSKKLSEKKRNYYYDILLKDCLGIGIGIISNKVIDEVNIYQATKLAMYEAYKNVNIKIDHVLIDAMPLDLDVSSTSIIKGDAKSLSIAAASVIAKVTRDKMMEELHNQFPMYGYNKNKGYPTKQHIEAISKYGILHDQYRYTYEPVSKYLKKGEKVA